MPREKYKARWPDELSDLGIELACIGYGGKWVSESGTECGAGMIEHLFNARKLIWPERYRHRWTDLLYENFVANDITILMGAASTSKTSTASEYALINYWARPLKTLVILSTITVNKLDTGVYGELKMLWQMGRKRFPFLAGNLLENKRAIVTDSLEQTGERDMRRGIVSKACFPSGTLVDTPTGPVPIESIHQGDQVINAAGIGTVRNTHTRIAGYLVRIRLCDDRQIDCTPEHPIFTHLGWKKAGDLKTSDWVLSPNETLSLLQPSFRPGISKSNVLFKALPGEITPSKSLSKLREIIPAVEASFGKILQRGMCWEVGSQTASKVCHYELPALWKEVGEGAFQPPILLCNLPQPSATPKLQTMRKGIRFHTAEGANRFLQSCLLREMDWYTASVCCQNDSQQGSQSNGANTKCPHPLQPGRTENSCGSNAPQERTSSIGNAQKIVGDSKVTRTMCFQEKGSGEQTDSHRNFDASRIPSSLAEFEDGSNVLQGRSRVPGSKTRRGIGWRLSQQSETQKARPNSGCDPLGTRVVSVEILERTGDPRYSSSEGGYRVHNLEVTGHPSYSVNNTVVHNCFVGGKWVGLGTLIGTKQEYIFYLADELSFMAETFIASWVNLFSNGNVKIIGSGNPKHDPDDQLGIAAEPKEGWTAHGVVDKTSVWETQFMGGKCVNLVGTDSPNMDVPEGSPEPYPKLIGRKFIKRIASDWGDNSPEFYTQCKGIMRIDMSDKRVITRLLCREHHAQDMVVWSPAKRTMILGLDPSYGGGDECIGTFLAFGTDDQGKELIAILEQKAYVMDMSKNMSMEDQIALSVKEDLRDRGIPASNCFYDPYGKGTMGFAFARVFGSDSPIPIDSGGQPTDRPVRAGLYVEEADGKRHLKTCREHYSKFVTEAWFSVRYIVESEQLRGLPTDCMLEGCARKYETVAGNKIEVESKDDYKGRVKHSPNRFDSLAIAVEGARQRGFGIDKLGLDVDASSRPGRDPFEEDARAWEELLSQSLLNHGDRKRELSLNL